MQKLVVALMMLSLFSCARAASASPHTDAVSAALVKARFDRALPSLEKCREEREQGHALICAHMHAAILKKSGQWTRVGPKHDVPSRHRALGHGHGRC